MQFVGRGSESQHLTHGVEPGGADQVTHGGSHGVCTGYKGCEPRGVLSIKDTRSDPQQEHTKGKFLFIYLYGTENSTT